MSDIDFDELDKAVNTLMGGVPAAAPAKTDDIKTLTIDSTLPDDSRPSFEKLDSALTQVNGPAAAPTSNLVEVPATPVVTRSSPPPLAARRSGRFMDVVHPSVAKAGLKPMSRVGATIQPAGQASLDGIKTPAIESNPEAIVPGTYEDASVVGMAVTPSEPSTSANESAPVTADWPDPLEMSGYGDESNVKGDADEVSAFADDQEQDDQQPPVSPFIADAKVEKRPLGGVPAETQTIEQYDPNVNRESDADDDPSSAEDATDQLPANPPAQDVQLPPELQSDLMAIETDGDTSAPKASSVVVATGPVVSEPATAAKASSFAAKTEASTASMATVGPTSIPQQYHEEPSTSDASNGSIYDTDSYHQPLAHPAKTKSGWLWIIWILLLLLVGGGGAVALYFVGII